DESILHLVLSLHGGGILPGVIFSDVSDTSGLLKVQFSTNVFRGRLAAPRSSVSRSLETIELAESTFKCPNCFKSDKIVPVTVRFMMCKYRFFGIKANGEQYTSDW
ncbi:hypothetical protein BGX23_011959, partial [Mortierella sp. AD031]